MFDCSKRKCPVAQGNKLTRKVLITTVHFVILHRMFGSTFQIDHCVLGYSDFQGILRS